MMRREAIGKTHYNPSTPLQTHISCDEQMFLSSSLNDLVARQTQKYCAGRQLAKKGYGEAAPSKGKNNIYVKEYNLSLVENIIKINRQTKQSASLFCTFIFYKTNLIV